MCGRRSGEQTVGMRWDSSRPGILYKGEATTCGVRSSSDSLVFRKREEKSVYDGVVRQDLAGNLSPKLSQMSAGRENGTDIVVIYPFGVLSNRSF